LRWYKDDSSGIETWIATGNNYGYLVFPRKGEWVLKIKPLHEPFTTETFLDGFVKPEEGMTHADLFEVNAAFSEALAEQAEKHRQELEDLNERFSKSVRSLEYILLTRRQKK